PTVILPDVSPHFIIYVYEHKPPRFRMIGPRSKAVYLTHTHRSQTIIFRFRPAVVSTIINSPISKWMDISTDISEAFVEFLQKEILLEEIERGELTRLIEYVLASLDQKPTHYPPKTGVSHFLIQHMAAYQKVGEAADALGVSSRYLRKKVKVEIGLSPKLLLKIGRLTTALAAGTNAGRPTFAQLAIEAGYYDQSHMIDEFQQFFGQTPGQLFS
ncbi:MAG: helix-turn-helix domain-containing protein, partial [Bacteroidota bacterium]